MILAARVWSVWPLCHPCELRRRTIHNSTGRGEPVPVRRMGASWDRRPGWLWRWLKSCWRWRGAFPL